MTTQVTVCLPDAMVEHVDSLVAVGQAASRTALVEKALDREIRRLSAERDAEILARIGPEDDLDELVAWATGQ